MTPLAISSWLFWILYNCSEKMFSSIMRQTWNFSRLPTAHSLGNRHVRNKELTSMDHLSQVAAETLIHTFIYSLLDYCKFLLAVLAKKHPYMRTSGTLFNPCLDNLTLPAMKITLKLIISPYHITVHKSSLL